MAESPRVLFVPVASKLHEPRGLQRSLALYKKSLEDLAAGAASIVTDPSGARALTRDVDAYIVAVLTGGVESTLLEIGMRGIPVALVAHPARNSLAAAVEAASRLRKDSFPARVFLLRDGVREDLIAFARAARAYRMLAGSRVLLIGDPSPWLVYSSTQAKELERVFGLELEKAGVDELLRVASAVPDSVIEELERELESVGATSVESRNLKGSLRLYVALREILERGSCNAATVRCFDLIERGCTLCLATSMLNDRGYAIGCEGDLPALLTMMVLMEVSGMPAFIGNVAWIEGTRLLLAHCTVPTKLVERFTLKTHFESGIGVAVQGFPRKGSRVTVARLDAARRTIRAGVGTVLNNGPIEEDLCRTQFLVELSSRVEIIVSNPAGNHYVLVLGDWLEPLEHFSEMVGFRFEALS
uniref:L-arabinose isomerase central domain-containing protein n=1 Tax=Fervidicoccus fontis TaxID=683846 RepID=A0A7J3ZK45_9CREN